MRKRSLLLVAGACVATLSLTAGAALADPIPPIPPDRVLAGGGSDTTQDVMNGFANGTSASSPPFAGVKDGAGNFVVSSFDATPLGSTVTPHPIPACTGIPRPSGSGAGVTALDNDTNGCWQFARSSADLSSSHPADTFIPFATDVLTFATAAITNVPKTFTQAQLTTIYTRNAAQGCIRQPLLPHVGSGTRSTWLTFLGIGGPGQPPLGDCVKDTLNGVPVEEHDGRVLTNSEQLVPFSRAQWITQTTQQSVTDRHGPSVLRAINGIGPFDPAFPFVRTVFNVVRTSDISASTPVGTAVRNTFVGSTSAICSHTEVTKAFGFTPASNCGVTTITN